MAVQVQVTWTVLGDHELEITSEFGHLDAEPDSDLEEDSPIEHVAPIEHVLEPGSSILASGLALQLA